MKTALQAAVATYNPTILRSDIVEQTLIQNSTVQKTPPLNAHNCERNCLHPVNTEIWLKLLVLLWEHCASITPELGLCGEECSNNGQSSLSHTQQSVCVMTKHHIMIWKVGSHRQCLCSAQRGCVGCDLWEITAYSWRYPGAVSGVERSRKAKNEQLANIREN